MCKYVYTVRKYMNTMQDCLIHPYLVTSNYIQVRIQEMYFYVFLFQIHLVVKKSLFCAWSAPLCMHNVGLHYIA